MEGGKLEFEIVQIENPAGLNLIFGTSHFIKTVEDLVWSFPCKLFFNALILFFISQYEALITSSTSIQFGLAVHTSSSFLFSASPLL